MRRFSSPLPLVFVRFAWHAMRAGGKDTRELLPDVHALGFVVSIRW